MATIDELASSRNWFRGDPKLPFTAVVDDYLCESLDLPTAVTKIVQPVNEQYTSGDQDTESLLWDLWYTILHAAKKSSRSAPTPTANTMTEDQARAANLDPSLPSPGHLKLLDLLDTLKTSAEPTPPADKTPDDWVFRADGKVWSALVLFGPATREVLNDAPGDGSGYEDIELRAWENLNAFLAHVARRRIADLDRMAVFALREGLERQHKSDDGEGRNGGRFRATEARKLDAVVSTAGIWALILGEELWVRLGEGQNTAAAAAAAAAGVSGNDVIPQKRWDTWVERFQFLSCREDLALGTRELAAQAVAIMKRAHV